MKTITDGNIIAAARTVVSLDDALRQTPGEDRRTGGSTRDKKARGRLAGALSVWESLTGLSKGEALEYARLVVQSSETNLPRTRNSPATDKQISFLKGLVQERVVNASLKKEIEAALTRGVSDGDCRKFIPLLQACPKEKSGYYDDDSVERWNNEDYGNWEDWRDHPDAVFGNPYR